MRKKITLALIITILLAGSFVAATSVSAQGGDLSETIPKLRIKFPQILESFSAPVFVKECPDGSTNCAPEQQRGYVYIPWLAQYVSAIYRYALGIASIMAVVAVMVGGIMYLTSAGSAGRIGEAKKIIFGAISGLVIIIFSYVLLNLVNPELVKLTPIRVEAVIEEVLATGNFCKDLDANKIVVDVGGTPQPPNFTGFECGKEYKVSAKQGTAISVPEGQTCFGDFCQKGGCAVSSGGGYECQEALFRGEITGWMRNFNSYIDGNLELRGMPGNEVIYPLKLGENDKTYTIPYNAGMEILLKKYDKVFFQFESNNTGCYAAMAHAIGVQGVIGIDQIIQAVKCFFIPTIDQNFYAIKHYDPANKDAIWGFPYTLKQGPTFGKEQCPNCFVLEKNKNWKFNVLPWCNFWEVEDIIDAAQNGSGTEVNFNLDNFPDLPPPPELYTKIFPGIAIPDKITNDLKSASTTGNINIDDIDWDGLSNQADNSFYYPYLLRTPEECNYYSQHVSVGDQANIPPIPGSPCENINFFEEKTIQSVGDFKVPEQYEDQTVTCRPTSNNIGQWVLKPNSQTGQPCDNLAQVNQSTSAELSEKALQNTQKGSQICDTSKNLECKYITGSTVGCEQISQIYYCYGTCGTVGEDFIKPGDACSGQCPTYKGETMYCVDGNCYLGTWGDSCNNDSDCASGYKCSQYKLFSGKICGLAQAQRWQACPGEGQHSACAGTLQCQEPEFHGSSADDSDFPICIDSGTDTSDKGVIDCGGKSNCDFLLGLEGAYPNYQISWFNDDKADYCTQTETNTTDAYCSKMIEGAWCKPGTIPSQYQSQYNCAKVFDEPIKDAIGIIQKIQN